MTRYYRERIWGLLLFDALAVLSIILLINRGIIPARGGGILVLFLFIVNMGVVISQERRSRTDSNTKEGAPNRSRWRVAIVFSLPWLVTLFNLVRHPSTNNGVQFSIATLLAGFVWYIVLSMESDKSRSN